jgi:PAS domain S-box-containing protein
MTGDIMLWSRINRPVWLGYSVGILVVVIAAIAHRAFFRGPGAYGPFVTFFPAVCIAAICGGILPGLLATTISVIYILISWNRVPYPLDLSVLVLFIATGIVVSFFASATHLFYEQGVVTDAVNVARDITERKQMEEALRESEQRLRLLGDQIPGGALYQHVRFPDGRLSYAHMSAGIEKILGISAESVLCDPESFWRLIVEEDLKDIVVAEEQSVREMRPYNCEFRMRTVRGELKWVNCRSMPRKLDDGSMLWDGLMMDITERKRLEEEHRKSRNDLESCVQERTKRLVEANRAYRCLSECNQAMLRLREEEELLQRVCQIAVDVGGYRMAWVGFAQSDEKKTVVPVASAGYDDGYLEQAKIVWADTERGRGPTGTAIRTGKIIASQNALSNPVYQPWRSEGTRRGYASSIALPLIVERNVIGALTLYAPEPDAFDEGESALLSKLAENLSYGIASIRVAEQRARTEEELRDYASRLEVINKELQDFAFAASHDLQEPLRKIQTFCDMAMKRCASVLDSASQEYLARVVNSASRMRDLLHALLQFSRVASSPEPLKRIDLNSLAHEALDSCQSLVLDSDRRVEVEDLPDIEADESQMLQLFQNLIGNALKFHGGKAPHIKVYSRTARNGMCEIFVEDNGIGFDQQFSEQVFKPFQKLHGRDVYDGTGMGLAICRKIAERHGGTIRVESEPGKGSTFIVRLPLKQAKGGV